MYQPNTVIAWKNPWIYIVRHDGADYRKVPWRVVLNPLRYEVRISLLGRQWIINKPL